MKKGKEPKVPQGEKARKMGYVSFSKEDVNTADDRNTEAEQLFLQALEVPKKVQKKLKKGKQHKINDNDYYPTSLEETQKMEELLNKADAAVTDRSDKEFMDLLAEMKDIISWSKVRHWNYSWLIIIGVIATVIFFFWRTSSQGEDVLKAEQQLEQVKNWNEDAIKEYKENEIKKIQTNHDYSLKEIERLEARLDTLTDKEAIKSTKNSIKNYNKRLKELQNDLSELQKADSKEIHKLAIEKHKNSLSYNKGEKRSLYFWSFFFLLLIPLYVFAERPYGYNISKYRTEASILGWIQRIGFGLAGGFVGAAGALQVTETVTKWSDGSKTREDDGIAIYAMKFILLIIALVIFCVLSIGLMIYSTIAGLIRNYNWKEIIAQKTAKKIE